MTELTKMPFGWETVVGLRNLVLVGEGDKMPHVKGHFWGDVPTHCSVPPNKCIVHCAPVQCPQWTNAVIALRGDKMCTVNPAMQLQRWISQLVTYRIGINVTYSQKQLRDHGTMQWGISNWIPDWPCTTRDLPSVKIWWRLVWQNSEKKHQQNISSCDLSTRQGWVANKQTVSHVVLVC